MMTEMAVGIGEETAKEVAMNVFAKQWRRLCVFCKYKFNKEGQFANYKATMQNRFEIVNNPVLENTKRKLDDVFIPQTVIMENSNEEILIDQFPWKMMRRHHNVIIKDTAGRGKSTLMKKMFLWCIEDKRYPVFVDLRNLKKNHLIVDEILKEVGEINEKFDLLLLQKFIDDGELIFFLDGFDEVAAEDCSDVARDIQDFVSRADNNMFILTSRDDDRLAGFAAFKGVRLKDFTLEESYELIRKYDGHTDKAEKIIELLRGGCYEEVKDFLRSPLHATMFYGAYHEGRPIPIKLHEVCRDIYKALYDNHDLSKNAEYVHKKRCSLSEAEYERILGCIGRYCLAQNTYEVDENQMTRVLQDVRDQCPGIVFRDEELLYDISICLSVFRKKRTSYVWIHEMMCHYFTARSICLENQTRLGDVLAKIYASQDLDRYVQMLRIYSELSPVEFRRYFLLELLKDYQKHYIDCLKPELPGIGSDSRELRGYLLFGHQLWLTCADSQIKSDYTPQRLKPLLPILYECHNNMFRSIEVADGHPATIRMENGERLELTVSSFSENQQEYDDCNMIAAEATKNHACLVFQLVQQKIKELENDKPVYYDKNLMSLDDGI